MSTLTKTSRQHPFLFIELEGTIRVPGVIGGKQRFFGGACKNLHEIIKRTNCHVAVISSMSWYYNADTIYGILIGANVVIDRDKFHVLPLEFNESLEVAQLNLFKGDCAITNHVFLVNKYEEYMQDDCITCCADSGIDYLTAQSVISRLRQ